MTSNGTRRPLLGNPSRVLRPSQAGPTFSVFLWCFMGLFSAHSSLAGQYDSYKGLAMFGYQGWFNCEGDGADKGWKHYEKDGRFEPGFCTIDFWPDVSEYAVTYATPFVFSNGSPASVFSAYDESTVDLHFKWMGQYGLDGAFMQRFTHSISDPTVKNHYMKVFDSAIKAATKYNRAISIRYDLTGCDAGDWQDLLADLDELDAIYDFHSRQACPTFLYHNGKPLIAIGGVGWYNNIAGDDVGYLDEAEHIIDGLLARGYSILIRVPNKWRVGGGTLITDPDDLERFYATVKRCDIVMPWHVGAYREESYDPSWPAIISGDIAWCDQFGLDYVPVIFPGFSRYNLRGYDDGSFRPRNKGSFFWLQASSAVQINAEMLFFAQFDEMDEGTQYFKCVKEVPVGVSPFIPYEEDVESDHYLWLAGESVKMLRAEIPFTSQMPDRVFPTTNRAPYCHFLLPPVLAKLPDGSFQARVAAFDYDGSIAGVGLRINDVYEDTDTLEPYTFTMNPGIGVHKLTAVAVDDGGATHASEVYVAVSATDVTFGRILITSTPATNGIQGAAYSYTMTAMGAAGDSITFSEVITPAWLNFDAGSGLLSGTPSNTDLGSHLVTLRVSGASGYRDQTFTILVGTLGNDAPFITSLPPTGVVESNGYSYTISALDADGDAMTYGAPVKPAWLSLSGNVLSGTPASSDVGLNLVKLNVSDGTQSVEQAFNIMVFATPMAANLVQNPSFELGGAAVPPWILGANSSGSTEDAQGAGSASLKLTTAPGNNKQTVPLQPHTDYQLSVWVKAAGMTSGGIRFDTNDKFDPGMTPGGTCQFNINLGDALVWTRYTGHFNSASETEVILRTYQNSMVGTVYFDNVVLAQVGGGNVAPVVTSVPVLDGVVNRPYAYVFMAADAESDPLTFHEVSTPAWLSFNSENGVLSGTPILEGNYPVELSVTDGETSTNQSFTITVLPPTGYDAWAVAHGITGGPTDDDNGNGLDNLFEYAVSGQPILFESGDVFHYVHKQRNDDPNLVFSLETTTDLLSGNWTLHGIGVVGTNVTGGFYHEITYSIPRTNSQRYIRLTVVNP